MPENLRGIFSSGGWWGFVRNIFSRLQSDDPPYPLPSVMRAQRAFEGCIRIAPLEWFDDVEIPEDFTERELGIKERWDVGTPINVSLPASGPPVLARNAAAMLARARELELYEIPVRIFWE